jgi:carbamate kinase
LSNPRSDLIDFAIDGNALVRSGEIGTFEGQYHDVQLAVKKIVEFSMRDTYRNRMVLALGNGQRVGATLVRHRLADDYYSAMPLYVCTAETQGFIGYIIEQALQDELDRANMNKNVTSLLTRVIVESNDTAFLNPTEPIGETLDDEMTDVLLRNVSHLYIFKKRKVGSGGTKFKLFIPSPKPITIVNYEAIRSLVNAGFIVVACGGGGIPVMKQDWNTIGVDAVDAVIDKDLASERLTTSIGASTLVLLTNVDGIYRNYGEKDQKLIGTVSIGADFEQKLGSQHLKNGGIGPKVPKVQASISFIRNGGREVIVCALRHLSDALSGVFGTHFFR